VDSATYAGRPCREWDGVGAALCAGWRCRLRPAAATEGPRYENESLVVSRWAEVASRESQSREISRQGGAGEARGTLGHGLINRGSYK
jgi:hypothetical protein